MKQLIHSHLQSYIKKSESYKAFTNNPDISYFLEGLQGYPLSYTMHTYNMYLNKRIWVIVPTTQMAKEIYQDLSVIGASVQLLPTTGKKLYSKFEGSENEYELVSSFQKVHTSKSGIIIVPLRTFATSVPSKNMLEESEITFRVNEAFDPTHMSEMLAEAGYYRSPSTTVPGEFSVHGEIFDFFPHNDSLAVRIHGGWDTIEKITLFDPITQDMVKTVSNITCTLLHDSTMDLYGYISDYIQSNDYFFFISKERLFSSFHSLLIEAKALYREAFLEDPHSIKPDKILFDVPSFYEEIQRKTTIVDVKGQTEKAYSFDVDGPHSYFGNFVLLKEDLHNLFRNNYNVIIFAGSEIQKKRLASMLSIFPQLSISTDEISGGFSIATEKLSVLCDHEIFGRRKLVTNTLHKVQSSPLDSFVDLSHGDYVVHVNYGIGRFDKIDRVNMSGRERDYIKIEYGDNEILFVPIEQANLIQRYIGSEGKAPKLDRIGGQGWEHKKAKARKSAEQLASRLIELYAKRKSSTGFAYPKILIGNSNLKPLFPILRPKIN